MAKEKKPSRSVHKPTTVSTKTLIPSVHGKNEGQKNLFRAMADPDNNIVLVDGAAGTGKSFCSMSWGLLEFLKGRFEKIIITRPVVEAGESLGFLPGTLEEKIFPYILPVMQIIEDHITLQDIKNLVAEGKIITTPLAYMRGMTFKKAFVLLDEAQNCTQKQMHLFLTRIGEGSKMVVTGDTGQSDLGPNNGFIDGLIRLQGVKGLEIVELDPNSIVRHGIIPDINSRYDNKLGRKEPHSDPI